MTLSYFMEVLNDNPDYIVIAVFLIILLFFCLELRSFKQKVFKDYKPLIISIGILGTFIGIFLGLWKFDTENITESVPTLLEGLKLAFTTSILGMFFSVVLSFIENLIKKEPSDTSEILQAILSEQKNINKTTNIIVQSVALSREDINSHFKTVNESLHKALKNLSQGATKEIISALNAVIADFNKNLKDQFGENFKQLNESVKKMIEWQENYIRTIEVLEQHLQKAISSIEKTSYHTEQFTKNYEKISEVNDRLKSIIEVHQKQINDMESHLRNLSKIGKEAELITGSINEFSKTIQKSISEQSEGLNHLSEELSKQLNGSLDNLNRALTTLTDKFRNDYESFLNSFKQLLDNLNQK